MNRPNPNTPNPPTEEQPPDPGFGPWMEDAVLAKGEMTLNGEDPNPPPGLESPSPPGAVSL
jgi:hypothetical protein